MSAYRTVVILGGGVGGVVAARGLRKRLPRQHRVVIVDREREQIPLKLGKPLPKAGVFAHGEAEVVAKNIAARWHLSKVLIEKSWLYTRL